MTQQMGSSTTFGELLKFPEHKVPLLQTKRIISSAAKASEKSIKSDAFAALSMTKRTNGNNCQRYMKQKLRCDFLAKKITTQFLFNVSMNVDN